MADLQATFEFSIELYKFYNVDLFQRGYYQVRVGLRVSPKLPVHIEASVPRPAGKGRPAHCATLEGGLATSRAFQIMYRNEEVTLRDIIHYRAHLLVDSRNLKESLERAEFSLGVELWCGEGTAAEPLAPVSCRVLKLHFQPAAGLHYHLPVIFDYFHLSAVSVTIHACLVALHQPYINTPRSSKQWSKLMKSAGGALSSTTSAGIENILFGSGAKCAGSNSNKIAHARQVHTEICCILLAVLDGLQNALTICGSTGAFLSPEEEHSNTAVEEVSRRLNNLGNGNARNEPCEDEEWAMGAANDIARLCAEVTLRWQSFLNHTSDRPHVHHALAARHHALRIKRFSECFFVLDNPRHSLAGCYDSNYQSYQTIGEAVRRSRYLALLPPLPVHCIATDGDPHIMPIIFEDRYQDTEEFARRRSLLTSGSNKSGSDPFLCTDPNTSDCACSISSYMDSRRPSSEASKVTLSLPKTMVDVLEPQLISQNTNVVQASLTLAPQKSVNSSPKRTLIKQNIEVSKPVHRQLELTGRNRYIVQNNQISEIRMEPLYNIDFTPNLGRQLTRFSSSTLDTKSNSNISQPEKTKQKNELISSRVDLQSGVNTLPARHSKSLDQLKVSQKSLVGHQQSLQKGEKSTSNIAINHQKTFITPHEAKPTTLPRSVGNNQLHQKPPIRVMTDEYQRNMNEFREKYKNPCNVNPRQSKEHHKKMSFPCNETRTNSNQIYGYAFGDQCVSHNPKKSNPNPLEFQRGYNQHLTRPMLPPRNSYPPVNGKSPSVVNGNKRHNNQVQRSNSSHVFHQTVSGPQFDIEMTRDQLRQELNSYLQKGDWSYDFTTGSLIHKKSSKSSDDSGFVMTLDRSSDGTSKSTYSKTPPSTPHSSVPSSIKQKKNRSKQLKSQSGSRDVSKINSSRDSLSSHHSIRSKDSKSERMIQKSDRATPKSGKSSSSGKATPKSGKATPKSAVATPKIEKREKESKSDKRSKHKASEKMSQLMSEIASSSSNESIPFHLRRLESSASVPCRLDHEPELLRHCRSAGSVLDEPNISNPYGSESLPNLTPPPAFGTPLLDFRHKDYKIMPPDIFKNKEDKLIKSNSTSSLSEQSGWVSSGRSSRASTPDNGSGQLNRSLSINKDTKYPQNSRKDFKVRSEISRIDLNGDYFKEKLLQLAAKRNRENTHTKEKVECCNKTVCEECTICSNSICKDSQCEYNKIFHNDDLEGDCCTSLCTASCYQQNSRPALQFPDNTVKKSHTIGHNMHPYLRKDEEPKIIPKKPLNSMALKDRIEYTERLLAAELINLNIDRKCATPHSRSDDAPAASSKKQTSKRNSEVNFDGISGNNEYEHLSLPPPQQFRDAPPPPDAFKDPPVRSSQSSRKSSKASTPSRTPQHQVPKIPTPLQLDNPLYHVCEGILERRKLRPHQAANTNATNHTNLSKSQSTGELASRRDSGEDKCDSDFVSVFGLAETERLFVKCRSEFRKSVNYPGDLYSDLPPVENSLPYFHISDEYRMFNPEGLHLVICVHGLDGNSADLRLVKTYLELGLPGARLDFLMSERNQGDTFSDFETMTDRLVQEIMTHIQNSSEPTRISFIGHSLGTIIIRSALARPQMKPFLDKLHTFLSLSGPHLGTLYNSSGLVNAGMWFMQKWKKSGSLLQLSLRDASDPRRSFLYRLSERSQLHQFRHILLCGSGQDRYVPLHSARLELCKAAAKDTSLLGSAYREMVHNMVSPLAMGAGGGGGGGARGAVVVRYDVQHALPHTASALVGRAAHIAALDSDLFIEKFLLVSALKYFR